MSPRIFWSRESGFSTKFPALQAIHAQNSAITGSTCRAESGFNSANDILTKRKGTLGPALFKSLALGKLNPDHFPSAASIRKRKLTPSGYNETNTPNTPIAQLWEQKDALALERRSKNKSRRKEPTDGGVEMERLVQAGSGWGWGGWGLEHWQLVWGTKEQYINIHNQCIEHTRNSINSHFPQIVLFEVGNSE